MKKLLLLLLIVYVGQINAKPCSTLIVTITPPNVRCVETPCQFIGTANPGPILIWQWSCKPSAGVQIQYSNKDTANFTFPNNTTYTITLIATNNLGQKDSTKTTVTVRPLPNVTIFPKVASGCGPQLCVAFSNNSTSAGICNWHFGNGDSSSSCAPAYCYTTYGTYTAILTLEDANACINSDTGHYTVLNCASINQSSYINILQIYPNPTSDQFFIEANTTDKLNVDLYEINGRHVFNANVSDKTNINVTSLNEGIYTMTVKTVDRIINKKLVIIR